MRSVVKLWLPIMIFLTATGFTKVNQIKVAEHKYRAAKAVHSDKNVERSLASIAPEEAQQLVKSYYILKLNDIRTLTIEIAEILGQHKGTLMLKGIESLTPEIAEELSKQTGTLDLSGLKTITPKIAEHLSKHKETLILDGLESLSPDVARPFAQLEGTLKLNGIKSVTPQIAEMLGFHVGNLYLGGLEEVTSKVALHLSKHRSGGLKLSGLKSITPEAAEYLARKKGSIDLSGLKSITTASTKHLGNHKGALNLSGLKSITTASAKHLGSHKGTLILRGIAQITPDQAYHLSRSDGPLDLSGVKSITPEVAEQFRKHTGGTLDLGGMEEITPEVAEHLSKVKCQLILSGLTSISSQVAKHLSRHTGSLNLSGVTEISPEIARLLSLHTGGNLNLRGLKKISPEVREHLSKHRHHVSLPHFRTDDHSTARIKQKTTTKDGPGILTYDLETPIERRDVIKAPILTIDEGRHKGRITGIFFSQDGKYLVTVSYDKTIRIWHVKTGDIVAVIRGQIGNGDDGKILAAAMSSDNFLLAVGGFFGIGSMYYMAPSAGDIRILDLNNRKTISLLKAHRTPVRRLKFSQNGKKLVSTTLQEDTVVWNMDTGEIQHVLKNKFTKVAGKHLVVARSGGHIDISPDATRIIAGGNLWNTSTGAFISHLKHPKKDRYSVRDKSRRGGFWVINDAFLARLSDAQKKQYFDPQTGQPYDEYWDNHKGPWIFTPNGRYIVSNLYGELLLWDGRSGKFMYTLERYLKDKKGLSTRLGTDMITFSPDGTKLITSHPSGLDRTSSIRDVYTFSPADGRINSGIRHEEIPRGVTAVSPNGRTAATGALKSNVIYLWDIDAGRIIKTLEPPIHENSLWAVYADEKQTTIQTADGYAELAETQTLAQTRTTAFALAKRQALKACKARIKTEINADHNVIWSAFEGAVSVLEQKDYGIEENRRYHVWIKAEVPFGIMSKTSAANLRAGKIWGVGFSKDGRSIAWGKKHHRSNVNENVPLDQSFQLWNEKRIPQIRMGPPLRDDSAYLRNIDTVNGRTIFTSFNILYIQELGQKKHRFHTQITNVYSYTFSPDGKLVIYGGDEGQLHAYDFKNRMKYEFVGHSGNIWGIAVSPNGRYMVSGSDDQTIKLWRLNTKEKKVWPTLSIYHGMDNEWVAWTPEGYYISSNYGDKYIGWHLNNGQGKSADYYSAFQFERIFYRPDIIHARLRPDKEKPDPGLSSNSFDIHQLKTIAPPKIKIHSPAYGDTAPPGSKVVLDFSVEKNSRPMINYTVFVNNIPVIAAAQRNLTSAEQHAYKRQIKIPLFNNVNKIRIEVFNGKSMGIGETLVYRSGAVQHKNIKGNLYLLSVGVNYFDHMPANNLMYASQDAENFSELFDQNAGKTYNQVYIKTISDNSSLKPTKKNILQALEFIKHAQAEDTVIIFLASHGISDYDGNYYFMPKDAGAQETESLLSASTRGITVTPQNMSSFISWEAFFEVLRSTAGKRLLVVDTCHAKKISGTLDIHSLAKRSVSSSFALMVASKSDEYSQEFPQGGHGLFTFAMLKGLAGEADNDQDGQISLKELYIFTSEYVKKNRDKTLGEQTPQLVGPAELKGMILKNR